MMRAFIKRIMTQQPLPARIAIGRAQLRKLEEEYAHLLDDPYTAANCQILFGWLESILEVGVAQQLWERSLDRARGELDSLRQRGSWSPSLIRRQSQSYEG